MPPATDDQFSQLIGRIKGKGGGVTGELVVTSVVGVAALLTPVLARFQAEHEGLTIRYLTDSRLFRLEYGEAHVAIRAGSFPQEPDNVVQPLQGYAPRLAASQGYAEASWTAGFARRIRRASCSSAPTPS